MTDETHDTTAALPGSEFVSSWRDLQRASPLLGLARDVRRRAALSLLGRRTRPAAPAIRIVHYHYVFDDQLEPFARQVEHLLRHFEPVSLSEAVRRLGASEVDGHELVVTFDDGFRNQLTNAAPVLAEAGFSACFFLIAELVSAPPKEAARICRERVLMPRAVEPLTWGGARELLSLGHEIGSHTRTHPNLLSLPPAALADEVSLSRAELEGALGQRIRHFSAPFGDRSHFGPAVSIAARSAGYESCSSAVRGINRSGADVFSLRRHHLVASWPTTALTYFLGS